MIEQYFLSGRAISAAIGERLLIASERLTDSRYLILECLRIGCSAANYEFYEIVFNGNILHREQFRTDQQITKYELPFLKALANGLLEIYVNAGGAGRTYLALVEGNFALPQ